MRDLRYSLDRKHWFIGHRMCLVHHCHIIIIHHTDAFESLAASNQLAECNVHRTGVQLVQNVQSADRPDVQVRVRRQIADSACLRREAGKARRNAWSTGGIWLKPAAVPTNGSRNGQPVELAALSCFFKAHEMNDSGTDPGSAAIIPSAPAHDHIDRAASPTAAIIDSQSVKSAEKGGPALTPMATMRARKLTARSVISW
jgi:hypothetical protein